MAPAPTIQTFMSEFPSQRGSGLESIPHRISWRVRSLPDKPWVHGSQRFVWRPTSRDASPVSSSSVPGNWLCSYLHNLYLLNLSAFLTWVCFQKNLALFCAFFNGNRDHPGGKVFVCIWSGQPDVAPEGLMFSGLNVTGKALRGYAVNGTPWHHYQFTIDRQRKSQAIRISLLSWPSCFRMWSGPYPAGPFLDRSNDHARCSSPQCSHGESSGRLRFFIDG